MEDIFLRTRVDILDLLRNERLEAGKLLKVSQMLAALDHERENF
jgi:hypothetical protein